MMQTYWADSWWERLSYWARPKNILWSKDCRAATMEVQHTEVASAQKPSSKTNKKERSESPSPRSQSGSPVSLMLQREATPRAPHLDGSLQAAAEEPGVVQSNLRYNQVFSNYPQETPFQTMTACQFDGSTITQTSSSGLNQSVSSSVKTFCC